MHEIFADLHLHSRYSGGTSEKMNLENFDTYGRMKGIDLIGVGDIMHPRWVSELKEKLVPVGSVDTGLFKLPHSDSLSFILTGEVSNNFTWENHAKRIHNLLFIPNFEILLQVNEYLSTKGKLGLDGRPDLSLSPEAMIHDLKSISSSIEIVAAHIWTSHFACLGARGFDHLQDCYGKETQTLLALETGLSSDPPMSWRVSELDGFTLISNSDCHSPYPSRIGREANLLQIKDFTYASVIESIRNNQIALTIETFPHYGKYHFTGHRADRKFSRNRQWRTHGNDICWSPEEAKRNRNICPICNQKLTIGVLQRVDLLSNRPEGYIPKQFTPYTHLIPLQELIAYAKGHSSAFTKTVWNIYYELINKIGSEYYIMLDASSEEIETISDPAVKKTLLAFRNKEIQVEPGFDGVYGRITQKQDKTKTKPQPSHEVSYKTKDSKPQARLDDFL